MRYTIRVGIFAAGAIVSFGACYLIWADHGPPAAGPSAEVQSQKPRVRSIAPRAFEEPSPSAFLPASLVADGMLGVLVSKKDASSEDLERLVFDLWKRRDELPAGAFEDLVGRIVDIWVTRFPEDAIRSCLGITDIRLATVMRAEVIGRIARDDPEHAIEIALKIPQFLSREFSLGAAFEEVALVNPREAIDLLDRTPPEIRSNLIASIFRGWAKRDPLEALEGLADFDLSESMKSTLRETVEGEWLSGSPGDYVDWRRNHAEGSPASSFSRLMPRPTGWSGDEFNRFWDGFRSAFGSDEEARLWMLREGKGSNYTTEVVARSLSGLAAGELLKYSETAFSEGQKTLSSAIWRQIGSSDPEAGLEWLAGNKLSGAQVNRFVEGWVSTDPFAALAALETIEPGTKLFRTLKGEAIQSASAGQEDRLLSELSSFQFEDETMEGFVAEIVDQVAAVEPALAADRFNEFAHLPGAGKAAHSIIYNLAARSPADAFAWAETLPPNLVNSDDALVTVLKGWLRDDPQKASEFVDGIDQGPVRDRAVQSLVEETARHDLDSAVIWAATISDASLRRDTLNRVASGLHRRGKGISGLIDHPSLSDQDRFALARQFPKSRNGN